jgi:molybdopterin synthase sulfur carrier subunit
MKVLFFAHLRPLVGRETVELMVSEPVTSDAFWELLIARFPALAGHKRGIRLAKNCDYVTAETRFGNDDEVALIPPVSGG